MAMYSCIARPLKTSENSPGDQCRLMQHRRRNRILLLGAGVRLGLALVV